MPGLTKEQQTDIDELRMSESTTRRPVARELEAILYTAFPVLDQGFLRVIDYMGDDSSVVQAARVSYGRGTKKNSEDRALINYLMKHWHSTPFEMASIKFHVKLPIFVARQWIRHRTASVNEYSARYSILDKEFYIPEPEQIAVQSQLNRQGRGDVLDLEQSKAVMELLRRDAENAYQGYTFLLNEDQNGERIDPDRPGLARELARMNLSLNYYTQWYWKTDLHNLMNFLRLRADPHAQYEIRVYAKLMLEILQKWVPMSYDAFIEHKMEARQFSASALKVIRRMVSGEVLNQSNSGLSTREWTELMTALELQSPAP